MTLALRPHDRPQTRIGGAVLRPARPCRLRLRDAQFRRDWRHPAPYCRVAQETLGTTMNGGGQCLQH